MALVDESFYNIIGEEISVEKIVQQMIDYYTEKLKVGETKVTDFNEGSEIRNLLESIAVDLYSLMEDNYEATKIAFIQTAYGEWLDLHGENPFINLPRVTGEVSTGIVTFYLDNSVDYNTVIPAGTIVIEGDNGLEFATDDECVIVAGETSADVQCSCLTIGFDGNVNSNKITIISSDSGLVYDLKVTNNDAFTGGADFEDDDTYRERLLNAVRRADFGSTEYYLQLGADIDGVHDVNLVSDPNFTKKVIVNGDVKPTLSGVLFKTFCKFNDEHYTLLGHKFIVDRPTYLTVNLTLNLTVSFEVNEENIKTSLKDMFDGGAGLDGLEFEGLSIGEMLTKNKIESAISYIAGVNEIRIFETGSSSEFTNLEADEDEVFKLGTVTINQTIIGDGDV